MALIETCRPRSATGQTIAANRQQQAAAAFGIAEREMNAPLRQRSNSIHYQSCHQRDAAAQDMPTFVAGTVKRRAVRAPHVRPTTEELP
jgi:hypothetical protein